MSQINTINKGECWLWGSTINQDGYGILSTGGKPYLAHRVTYEDVYGQIPIGLEIDHLCRVPSCVNPNHLEAVTHRLNMQRRFGVGLCKRGHKLTKDNTYVGVKNRKTGRVGRQCKTCARYRHKQNYLLRAALKIIV